MANPIVNLNVRANTARAMADFKKFSDSLNNKFLVSGLKIDLVTSTLKQINNEFQKSMGEQGLLGASSIKAAQNQAAMIMSAYKGFGLEASKSINANMTKALSDVAVKAGGTIADIKKTMSAVPYLSVNLSEGARANMAKQILSFQRDLRRAGISEEFGNLGQKFLSGESSAMELASSPDAISKKIGIMMMAKYGASSGGVMFNAEARTEVLKRVMEDPELRKVLQDQAKSTFGFRTYIEDLNTSLFNPESGLLGSLRRVKMSANRTTTIFDETDKLVNSIFGPKGIFIKFFTRIAEVFRINDPLKLVVMGMDFLQVQIQALSRFLDNPKFKEIVGYVKIAFEKTWEVFSGIYDQVTGANFDSTQIVSDIKQSGEGIRQFIKNIGATIRGEDISQEAEFGTSIVSTLVEETGKTVVVLIKELFSVFVDKAPEIAGKALPALSRAFNSILTEMFGSITPIVKTALNFAPGPLGVIARTSTAVDAFGAGNPLALAGVGAAAFAPSLLGLLGGARKGYSGLRDTSLDRADTLRRLNRLGPRRFLSRYLFRRRDGRWGDERGDGGTGPRGGGPGGSGPGKGPIITQTLRNEEGRVLQYGSQVSGLIPDATDSGSPSGRERRWGQGRGILRRSNMQELIERNNRYTDMILRRRANEAISRRRLDDLYNYEFDPLSGTMKTTPKQELSRVGMARIEADKHARQIQQEIDDLAGSGGFNLSSIDSDLRGRYRRRYNPRARFGRFIKKNKGAIIGTALTAGVLGLWSSFGGGAGSGKAATMGIQQGDMAKMAQGGAGVGDVLGGGFEGATIGATIGSIVPGIGTVAGAVIGGVIGGVLPLLDKGTKDGVAKFVDGFGGAVSKWITSIGTSFSNGASSLWNGITGAVGNFANGFKNILFKALDSINIFKNLSSDDSNKPGFLQNLWNAPGKLWEQITYQGLNSDGPAMNLEARMSGANPIRIANDREFIIPSGGFSTLAGLLETKINSSARSGPPLPQERVELTININNPVMLGDNKELIENLRQPVIGIINDAYKKTVGNRVSNQYIS